MKRRNFLRDLGLGTAATMIPVTLLPSVKTPKKTLGSIITSFDAKAVLKNNAYFKILNRYARELTSGDKRNKVWITGSHDRDNDISEIHLNILFESAQRGYHKTEFGYKPLDGIIIKERFTLDADKSLNKQVEEAYAYFFDVVMLHHFGLEQSVVFQKGMYDNRLPTQL